MCYEKFNEAWNELTNAEKIALFNEYASEHDADDMIFDFTDDFLNEYFSTPADAARAVHFGRVNWGDDYVRFNGYGNLTTMSEYEAAEFADMFTREIYDADEYGEYIEEEEEEEDAE